MSVVESAPPPRPGARGALFWVRRAHLYLGLFLMPWAVLYGVTAFLFNHPGAFSEQATAGFGRAELNGTPMESPPSPAEVAAAVVEALNDRAAGARSPSPRSGPATASRSGCCSTRWGMAAPSAPCQGCRR